MRPIKYIAYFDFQYSKIKRNYVTSATNKIESICELLNSNGYSVEIISISNVIEKKFHVYHGSKKEYRPGLTLKLFSSWGGTNKFLRSVRIIWHLLALFIYLIFHTKKNDIVVVYHSQGYFDIIHWAKKIRRFKMLLEVEEIYDDVGRPKYKVMSMAEKKMIKDADAFIFPSDLMNKIINTDHKPAALIYGSYHIGPNICDQYNDGNIHVIYAGTFDPRKGGAIAAISAAKYLPKNYHIHICGFGSVQEVSEIEELITTIQGQSKAKIIFEGLKTGKEYITILQKCHIGLSTQNPTAAFNATSFPSKILSYMANGLSVVSIEIPAISSSKIAPYLNFYKDQTGKDIAAAILKTELKNDNRRAVARLAEQFKIDINNVIQNLTI